MVGKHGGGCGWQVAGRRRAQDPPESSFAAAGGRIPHGMANLRSAVPSFFVLAGLAVAQGGRGLPDRVSEPLAATAPAAVLQDLGPLPPLVVDAASPAETWVVGRGYKARIDAAGLLFHALPGPELPLQPVALALQQVLVSGLALPLRTSKRPDDGNRCVLDHGSVHEHFDLRPEGVEQSFHFANLPTRGELVVRIAVTTALAAVPQDGGVRFGTGPQAVHYGSATVLDAAGRRLALPSEWIDGGLQITVPASFVESASLPLVVDPLLSTPATWVLGTGTGSNLNVAGPDLAFSPVTDSWLLVWQVQVASNDHDVYARRFDVDWNPLGSAQGVDVSTLDWSVPKVAHLRMNDEWRIAAYAMAPSGTAFNVHVRRWSAIGAVGTAFVVGSAGGTAVPKFGPAIGGDPYAVSGPSRVCVAWPSTSNVRYTTVDEVGTIGGLQVISGVDTVADLAISKGNGASRWLLVWGEWGTVAAQPSVRYRGALVAFSGGLVGVPLISFGSHAVYSPTPAAMIATSSPDVVGDYTVVYEEPFLSTMRVRKVRFDGSVTAETSIDSLVTGWGWTRTNVETDGVRTLATKAQGNDVRGVLLACDATVGTWRDDDQFLIAGTSPIQRTAPSSRFVFESDDTVRPFTLAYSLESALVSAVRIVQYAGYVTGTGYSIYGSACGVPLSLNHNGTVPALGNTVTFNLGTTYPIAGYLFGTPAALPLTGICSCTLGVDGTLLVGYPLVLPIPLNVNLVGLTFSIQGFSFQAGPCFGSASLSNTIDMTIQ